MVNVASLSLMTKFAHEGLPRHLPVQVGTSQQEMRSDMWNIRLTAREAVHGQHHPQQRDLLEVMNSFSHFGDAAPAGKINRRISQPITSLAGGERRRLFTYRTMVSGDENGDSGK
ncbi:uncharacterized protein ACWYII_018504 isoform 3-T3 [Salvelinus alpinus]